MIYCNGKKDVYLDKKVSLNSSTTYEIKPNGEASFEEELVIRQEDIIPINGEDISFVQGANNLYKELIYVDETYADMLDITYRRDTTDIDENSSINSLGLGNYKIWCYAKNKTTRKC